MEQAEDAVQAQEAPTGMEQAFETT